MENLVGCTSPIWLNQFRPTTHRSIQRILIPTPCKKVTEMAKAMPQNGFLSLSWIKIKDIEKRRVVIYLTSSAGRTSASVGTTTLSVSGTTHTRGGTSL